MSSSRKTPPSLFSKGAHRMCPENFCKYIHRYCNQTRIEGYDYCIRHILEDKTAPFKQCTYVQQPNNRRCTNAAPKNEKNDKRGEICPFHTKMTLPKPKTKSNTRKKKAVAVLPDEGRYDSIPCENVSPTTLQQVEDSFVHGEEILEKVFVDTPDDDNCFVDGITHPLENAGVYTHKEVCMIARHKILSLQQVYVDELKTVYHQLKECKRKFLAEFKKPISTEDEDDVEEVIEETILQSQISSKELKSLYKYHRLDGPERLMRHKIKVIPNTVGKNENVCLHVHKGKKCNEKALPMSEFCRHHILLDDKQVLFKPCDAYGVCKKPILPCDDNMCPTHWHLDMLQQNPVKVAPSATITSESASASVSALYPETEHFQSMDDIASLGLDAITPGSLFGLDQFGEPKESPDTFLSDD